MLSHWHKLSIILFAHKIDLVCVSTVREYVSFFIHMLCFVVSDIPLNVTLQSVSNTTIMLSWIDLILMDDTVSYYQVMYM